MDLKTYVEEAQRTKSTSFHENICAEDFGFQLETAFEALSVLDDVKKAIFYGRDTYFDTPDPERYPALTENHIQHIGVDTLHAVIGIATEAGELLEAIYNAYENGSAVDEANLQEELGDLMWYMALLIKARNLPGFEELAQANNVKLRKRFPYKFSDELAIQRLDKQE